MTPQEAADVLTGREYRDEIPKGFAKTLSDAGLVAIYGASDDLMEIEGAASDEFGAYNGGEAFFTKEGLLTSKCANERCPYHEEQAEKASRIEALWDVDGFSWRYKTDIPHAKFVIFEDEEPYCEGIVFALADVPA